MRDVVKFINPYDPGLFPEDFPDKEVVNLSSNENPYDPSEEVKEAYLRAVKYITRYPKADYLRLKKALADYTGFDVENIAVGCGASELISCICNALLEELDRVVIPMPSYTLYSIYAMLRNASISFPVFEGYRVDPDAIAAERPKLVFLCSPNNPTGNSLSKEVVEKVAGNAEYVVLDEAYVEFSNDSKIEMVKDYDNLIVLRSFSKFFALAGMRVGYAVCSAEIAEAIEKVRLPFSISYPAVEAAIAALGSLDYYREIRNKIVAERDRLIEKLRKIEWLEVYPSDANFVLVKARKEGVIEKLAEKGFIVRDASVMGLEGLHIRITVGKPEDNERLIEALNEI
jgi:histidinol-phosphate aminotransferase